MTDIIPFVRSHLLKHKLHGILQVGSTARNYTTSDSDVDFHVFYDAGKQLRSAPIHTKIGERNVTIEHHDLKSFQAHVLDFKFNLASLRQLLKVRDSKVIEADDTLSRFVELAKEACLDSTTILNYLDQLATSVPGLVHENPTYEREFLIRAAESLATLELLGKPNQPAYSKPKWLYIALKKAGKTETIALLDSLYLPTPEKTKKMVEAVNQAHKNLSQDGLPEGEQIMIATALRNLHGLLEGRSEEAFPLIHFLAVWLHYLIKGQSPLSFLKQNQAYESGSPFEILFREIPEARVMKEARRVFLAYCSKLASGLIQEISNDWQTEIGTRLFMNLFVEFQGIAEVFPKCSKSLTEEKIERVKKWLEI